MIRVYSYIRVKVRSGKADVRDSRYRREPDGGKCRKFRVDGPAWCRQQIDSRGSDEDERSRRLNGQLLLRWTDGRTDEGPRQWARNRRQREGDYWTSLTCDWRR